MLCSPSQTTKVFPAQSPQMLFLSLDKSPGEHLAESKKGSCITAWPMELTNQCVIKERESHGKQKPVVQPPGQGVRWLWSGTSDPCSFTEFLCMSSYSSYLSACLLLGSTGQAVGVYPSHYLFSEYYVTSIHSHNTTHLRRTPSMGMTK